MSKVLHFTRAPIRFIELRAIDRRRGNWQAVYAGDEWTPAFVTTIGQLWQVEDGLRYLETCHGLPLIVTDGDAVEVAA